MPRKRKPIPIKIGGINPKGSDLERKTESNIMKALIKLKRYNPTPVPPMIKLAVAGQRQSLCFMGFSGCEDIIYNLSLSVSWQDVIHRRICTQRLLHTNHFIILDKSRYFTLRILQITKIKRISQAKPNTSGSGFRINPWL